MELWRDGPKEGRHIWFLRIDQFHVHWSVTSFRWNNNSSKNSSPKKRKKKKTIYMTPGNGQFVVCNCYTDKNRWQVFLLRKRLNFRERNIVGGIQVTHLLLCSLKLRPPPLRFPTGNPIIRCSRALFDLKRICIESSSGHLPPVSGYFGFSALVWFATRSIIHLVSLQWLEKQLFVT